MLGNWFIFQYWTNSNWWYWNFNFYIWFVRIIWIQSGFKSIGHNTYTEIRSNVHSKPTPIHVQFHKYDFNYSYSRSHFSRLPQEVAKKVYCLLQKVSYASKIIDRIINVFSTNYASSHLHIYNHSIVTFGIG